MRKSRFWLSFLASTLLCLPAVAQSTFNMQIGSNVTAKPPGSVTSAMVLADLRPFACIRFMDWEGTVTGGVGGWNMRDPVPESDCVRLCNALPANGWFCVRHDDDDATVRQLAMEIFNNLDPKLKAYIEYSNETWNTAVFWLPAVLHCENLAKKAGIVPPKITDQVSVAGYGHVYRACQIWKIFEEVFGDQMSKRVVKVIAGHAYNGGLVETHMRALKDPKVNPDRMKMDAYAIAPYFGAGESFSSIDQAMALAKGVKIGGLLKTIREQYNAVAGAKAVLIGYEGGSHFSGGQTTFNTTPGAYDVIKAYLNTVAPFMDLLCHYSHVCLDPTWSAKPGGWGQDPSGAPKYRALLDWAREYPYTPPAVATKPAGEYAVLRTSRAAAWPSATVRAVDLVGRTVLSHRPSGASRFSITMVGDEAAGTPIMELPVTQKQ